MRKFIKRHKAAAFFLIVLLAGAVCAARWGENLYAALLLRAGWGIDIISWDSGVTLEEDQGINGDGFRSYRIEAPVRMEELMGAEGENISSGGGVPERQDYPNINRLLSLAERPEEITRYMIIRQMNASPQMVIKELGILYDEKENCAYLLEELR